MKISDKAKWGIHQKIDENAEIAIAKDEEGNVCLVVKCLAKHFQKKKEKQ